MGSTAARQADHKPVRVGRMHRNTRNKAIGQRGRSTVDSQPGRTSIPGHVEFAAVRRRVDTVAVAWRDRNIAQRAGSGEFPATEPLGPDTGAVVKTPEVVGPGIEQM